MAMVGQKTEEVYRRYAIVDDAMIREAAIKMNRGAKTRRATAQRTAESALSVANSQGHQPGACACAPAAATQSVTPHTNYDPRLTITWSIGVPFSQRGSRALLRSKRL